MWIISAKDTKEEVETSRQYPVQPEEAVEENKEGQLEQDQGQLEQDDGQLVRLRGTVLATEATVRAQGGKVRARRSMREQDWYQFYDRCRDHT